jgi:hypothetical protein
MIILPRLIEEKVEFYYYRQKWLDNIKIMHEQYRKCVVLTISGPGCTKSTFVTWVIQHYYWHPRLLFLPLDGTPFRMIEGEITPFNKVERFKRYKLPGRYYYSSGLNDPTGYK